MHIQESATHQLGKASRQCAQKGLQQEQIQTPEVLENYQQCRADSFNNRSIETPLPITLANCESVSGIGFQQLLAEVTNVKQSGLLAMTPRKENLGCGSGIDLIIALILKRDSRGNR